MIEHCPTCDSPRREERYTFIDGKTMTTRPCADSWHELHECDFCGTPLVVCEKIKPKHGPCCIRCNHPPKRA